MSCQLDDFPIHTWAIRGVPEEIRTPVPALKGQRPGRLDDGNKGGALMGIRTPVFSVRGRCPGPARRRERVTVKVAASEGVEPSCRFPDPPFSRQCQ